MGFSDEGWKKAHEKENHPQLAISQGGCGIISHNPLTGVIGLVGELAAIVCAIVVSGLIFRGISCYLLTL